MNCFGADMSDPRMNVFYSHSYIFNFGCPFYGTGAGHAASPVRPGCLCQRRSRSERRGGG
ncbi:MAG: hypothetical protein H0T83_04440 [Chthoniobacterales bacterium]|nr:hypothetical protein [Chthoniobacterales bacterium]